MLLFYINYKFINLINFLIYALETINENLYNIVCSVRNFVL